MRTADLHWLAGLVEGEGCPGLGRGKYATLQLSMVDEDVVRRAAEVAGVGKVYGPYGRPDKPGSQLQWQWQVTHQADAAALLMTLYPLLGRRRQGRIREILEVWRAAPTKRRNPRG